MANIIDYLKWRGDLSLTASPFNQVDNLILSQFSYYPFEYAVTEWKDNTEIRLGIAAQKLLDAKLEQYSVAPVETDRAFLEALAASVRFKDATLTNYVNSIDLVEEKQFSALQIMLDDDTDFIVFRGTDNTLAGWKEDLNMAFETEVPAQEAGRQYLNRVAVKAKRPVRLGGHSKGGNLAVYSAAFCDDPVRNVILTIYNNDGPGFNEKVSANNAFQAITTKIHSFVPQSSLVGRLMEHKEELIVIESSELGGINQHDPFSWQVLGSKFIKAEKISDSSRIMNTALKSWMKEIDLDERRKLIDGIFTIFENTDVRTLDDLILRENVIPIIKALGKMDEKTGKLMQDAIIVMSKSVGQALGKRIEESEFVEKVGESVQKTKIRFAENISTAEDFFREKLNLDGLDDAKSE